MNPKQLPAAHASMQTWDVKHYRNWRGLETSKDLHRAQMPSKISERGAAHIRPHIPFHPLTDQPRGHSIGCRSRGLFIVFSPAQGCSRGHLCCSFYSVSPFPKHICDSAIHKYDLTCVTCLRWSSWWWKVLNQCGWGRWAPGWPSGSAQINSPILRSKFCICSKVMHITLFHSRHSFSHMQTNVK